MRTGPEKKINDQEWKKKHISLKNIQVSELQSKKLKEESKIKYGLFRVIKGQVICGAYNAIQNSIRKENLWKTIEEENGMNKRAGKKERVKKTMKANYQGPQHVQRTTSKYR